MNNKKATKRALLTSVMALAMCVVMLIGTTFAWFTDTATANVNRIQSGTLDVDIVTADDSHDSLTGTGSSLKWTQMQANSGVAPIETDGLPLWEPGASFLTQEFQIANKGNLALKWKVRVNMGATSGNPGNTADLLDVIDFYLVKDGDVTTKTELAEFNGELTAAAAGGVNYSTEKYCIMGKMQETANNDYQGLTLNDITITVYATQLNSEYDSSTKDYDKDATYSAVVWSGRAATDAELAAATDETAKTVSVNSGELLAALAAKVNAGVNDYAGYTIKLTENIDLNDVEWTPIGKRVKVNGVVDDTTAFKGVFDGDGHTLANLKITNYDGYAALFGAVKGATIKNLTVSGKVSGEDVAGIVGYGANSTMEKCYNEAVVTATGGKAAGIAANFSGTLKYCANSGAVTTEAAQPAGGLVAWSNAPFTVENCENTGAVTVSVTASDSSQAGGICGNLASGSTIKNCRNSGAISASLAGGVAGRANGGDITIDSFTNTGSINGDYAGGVIGDAKNGVGAKNCTISGTVSGTKAAGGIFAEVINTNNSSEESAVSGCTVTAAVTSNTADRAGKFVGILSGVTKLDLAKSSANDIGCFAGAKVTITGAAPNNIDFTTITDGLKTSPTGFVHENLGKGETIIFDGKTYTYHGDDKSANAYTWGVASTNP